MGRRFALVPFVAGLVAVPSLAAAGTLSLARVLDAVRTHNPTIASARARADAAATTPRRVSAYDDPVFSWETWNVPESVAIDRADNNILRVSQKIPFPGKRTLAGEMAARDADVMAHDAGAVELDAVTLAKRAYADLWRAHRTLAVARRDFALADRIERLVEQRYAVGTASQAEVLRAQVEVSHANAVVLTGELAIDEARAGLRAVLSDADLPLGDPEDPADPSLPPSPEALVARALSERPELAARDAAIAREATGERLAEKGYLPDFEVSVERFLNHDAPNGFGAMASFTVPLVWKGKYDAGVAEAKARIISAEAERRVTSDAVRRDVEQAFARARMALVQHDLFAVSHVPQAEQALRVTEASYVAGTDDLGALIETVREVERVHLEHVNAAADFEKAYADLERAVGADLPRAVARPAGRHRHD